MRKKILSTLLACLFISGNSLLFATTQNQPLTGPSPDEIMRFSMIYAQIKQFYVKEQTDEKLFKDALHGMVSGLDPHSIYLDEEELEDFASQTEGKFVGLGVEITNQNGTIKVVSPIDGSPAQKAGIKAGDYILAENNKPLIDMPINEAVKLLRGTPGSKVTITVLSKDEKKPRKITLIREPIKIDSVRYRLFDGKYGYIRISQFQPDSAKKVSAAIRYLENQTHGKLAGLLIDLRNNPGGLLDSAVKISDSFLDSNTLKNNKKIVYTKGRIPQASETYNATPGDAVKGIPIVVLINEGSASASEIVAGSLQDHKRAIIVGQKSFGKGSVQTLLPVGDKEAVKITTALYYTPNGRSIQAEGIQPDITINDMKVQTNKDDQSLAILQIKEASLSGHLANGNKNPSPNPTKKSGTPSFEKEETSSSVATEDYPLYEALNTLKTLCTLQKNKA